MQHFRYISLTVFSLVLTMLFMLPTTLRAELIITGASTSEIEVGTKLPDNTRLNIPKDITVSILKTPEQETYVVKGPFVGTLSEYVKKRTCKWYQRIFGRCGREDNSNTPTGGVRSIKKPEN